MENSKYNSSTETALSVKSVTKGSKPEKAIITLVDKKDNTLPADTADYYLGTKATTKSKNASGRLLQNNIGLSDDTVGKTIKDNIAPSILTLDDQEKKATSPQSTGQGSSDKVPAVWAEYNDTDSKSMIYIQMNEVIKSLSGPAGFVVKVNGSKVDIEDLDVSTANGVYAATEGNSLIKIEVRGKRVMAGDTIDIGAAVIVDDSGNTSDAISTSVQYRVDTVESFEY